MGNGELSRRLQLPRATVSRICKTLYELGYLDWDPKLDKYFVSAQVLALGYPYLTGLPMRHTARPLMQALADRIDGAVSMGVAHRLDVTYLLTCTHNEGTPARPGVGAVRSVLNTGMGRAFLCTLSKAEFQRLMEIAQRERPDEYAANYDRICHNVAHYPKRGYAINEGEAGIGVHGVGIYSRIVYLNRPLLFNCAIAGSKLRRGMLEKARGADAGRDGPQHRTGSGCGAIAHDIRRAAAPAPTPTRPGHRDNETPRCRRHGGIGHNDNEDNGDIDARPDP